MCPREGDGCLACALLALGLVLFGSSILRFRVASCFRLDSMERGPCAIPGFVSQPKLAVETVAFFDFASSAAVGFGN